MSVFWSVADTVGELVWRIADRRFSLRRILNLARGPACRPLTGNSPTVSVATRTAFLGREAGQDAGAILNRTSEGRWCRWSPASREEDDVHGAILAVRFRGADD